MPAESGRGMTPTARALALADSLHAALKDLEVVVRRKPSFDPKTDARTFQVVATDNAGVVLGLPMIRRIAACTGCNVRVAFRHYEAVRVHDQLERGEVDLLVGSDHAILPSMKTRRLIDENFVMVQRKGHPRGRKKLDLDTYCGLRHLLVSVHGGSLYGHIDEHLATLGRTRDVVLSVQQFTLVPEILKSTDYVCAFPSRLARRYADVLDAFELPFEVKGFTLYAAWHPRNQHDPAARWLRDLVADCAAEAGGVEKIATAAKPRRR
jgi:DNA-binding transcriptional LysR family regulator